ncbi:MAG: aminotransferase class IV [Chitinophagaceae bacterium]|nr:aminotransferase class IV [Chitinophagaceae bacterium]
MNHFIFNGKMMPGGIPVIGASNRGLRYGDGLFETIKCVNAKLQLANAHFARLWKGMSVLKFKPGKHFGPEMLEEEILALAKKNGHLAAARIRLTLFRGDGGLYDAVNHQPNYLIESMPLPEAHDLLNQNGLVLGIYPEVSKNSGLLSNLKHNNYLPYVLAALYAKEQQWNDAILLNEHGRLCDTTIANLYLLKEETFYTPALSEGCVAGVMREHLNSQLPGLGYPVTETLLTVDDLMQCEEAFLSNSIHPIRWVHRIGEKTFTNRTIQQIYHPLCSTID